MEVSFKFGFVLFEKIFVEEIFVKINKNKF